MPHHESGLLAIRTQDRKLLDLAVAHFRAQEPGHSVEAVRVDGGRGVWLCFSSVISDATGEHVDLSAFQDQKALAGLAKKLRLPIWVGFAIGGYSNHQFASAFSAKGERLWSSETDFAWPKELASEAKDPFTSPARYQQLAVQNRQRAGYGKIGQEFGTDYFRVLSVDVGDPLFATDKRFVPEEGFAALTGWLAEPWKNPEGDPGDAAAPVPPAEWVAWRLPKAPEAIERLAGVVVCALEHLGVPPGDARLTVTIEGGDGVVVLDGSAARVASPLVLTERFTDLASRVTGTELSVFRGEGDGAELSVGVGAPGGMFSLIHRGGPGLRRPQRGRSVPLRASKEVREMVAQLRAGEEAADAALDELLFAGAAELAEAPATSRAPRKKRPSTRAGARKKSAKGAARKPKPTTSTKAKRRGRSAR